MRNENGALIYLFPRRLLIIWCSLDLHNEALLIWKTHTLLFDCLFNSLQSFVAEYISALLLNFTHTCMVQHVDTVPTSKFDACTGQEPKPSARGPIILCQQAEELWQEIALGVSERAKHIFRFLPVRRDSAAQLSGQDSPVCRQLF